MRSIALTPISKGPGGYLGSLVSVDHRVWAVGGTHRQPTILYSDDRGHTFAPWTTPTPNSIPGLRDVHVEGQQVWVVGEWGGVASTVDAGKTWEVIKPAQMECLYSIMRGADRRMWILGDGGLLLRSRRSKRERDKDKDIQSILDQLQGVKLTDHERKDLAKTLEQMRHKKPVTPQQQDQLQKLLARTPNKSRTEGFDRVANQSTARLLYMFVEETSTWLIDSAGMMQRNTGRGFEVVPLKAMRTARPLCALVRTPKQTLILLGDGGLVLRSTNDGKTWKKISVDSRNDLEKLIVTRYGIFVVGAQGSLLVSHDDGQSFQGLDTKLTEHLWSLAEIDGELLIGGEGGKIWRIEQAALADLLSHAYAKRDTVLADLAARLRDGDEGADLVLEDALKERELL